MGTHTDVSLVGRGLEQALLDGRVARIATGEGAAVVLAGVPGAGNPVLPVLCESALNVALGFGARPDQSLAQVSDAAIGLARYVAGCPA